MWALPLGFLAGRPSISQPQLCAIIAAVVDKLLILGIGNQAIAKLVGGQVHPVSRCFVIEGKTRTIVTDLNQASGKTMPRQAADCFRSARVGSRVGRQQRIMKQGIFEIGEKQFLVLLLMLDPQPAAQFNLPSLRVLLLRQQVCHVAVDMAPISHDFGNRGTRQQATPGSGELLPDGVVIGVEEHGIGGFQRVVILQEGLQQEGFKKPAGMRYVPFGRAGECFGLEAEILDGQWIAGGQ